MRKTKHYKLPLFDSNDQPKWLVDWNEAMAKIDIAIHVATTGDPDVPDISELYGMIQELQALTDNIVNNLYAEYDNTRAYAKNDFCTHNGELYICTEETFIGDIFNPSNWSSTNITSKLTECINTFEKLLSTTGWIFDKDTNYSVNDFVWHDGEFYKFRYEHTAHTDWNDGEVETAHIGNEITNLINRVTVLEQGDSGDIIDENTTSKNLSYEDILAISDYLGNIPASYYDSATQQEVGVWSVPVLRVTEFGEHHITCSVYVDSDFNPNTGTVIPNTSPNSTFLGIPFSSLTIKDDNGNAQPLLDVLNNDDLIILTCNNLDMGLNDGLPSRINYTFTGYSSGIFTGTGYPNPNRNPVFDLIPYYQGGAVKMFSDEHFPSGTYPNIVKYITSGDIGWTYYDYNADNYGNSDITSASALASDITLSVSKDPSTQKLTSDKILKVSGSDYIGFTRPGAYSANIRLPYKSVTPITDISINDGVYATKINHAIYQKLTIKPNGLGIRRIKNKYKHLFI